MRVSLNLIKKYVDFPKEITNNEIAQKLTLKTVEVENVENTAEKFNNIIVGKILEVKKHPNADLLRICIVDIGEDNPVQIVCGGENLYVGENVVVCKPGAIVLWHGEGEPIEIKETKMRGENSYGMICASSEVYLENFYPSQNEKEIIDLKDINCLPGQNIADVLNIGDTILEIDNKSLTNRPDLWGHYGIARELSVIFDLPLKEIPNVKLDNNLPNYNVEIENSEKCHRFMAIEIKNIENKKSPLWMQGILTNCGLRPINAIVDITNYVMITTGQPMHAYDKSHILGNKIIVRNAKENEELLLLDDNKIKLSNDDLVICNTEKPMNLAGIKGGKDDSILETTKDIVIEIASFDASMIRKTDKKFAEKTEAAIRYEKGIDTERVNDALSLTLELIKEIFPNSNITKYTDNYPCKTQRAKINVPNAFLKERLGKELEQNYVENLLIKLGYDVNYNNNTYEVLAPVFRSTGDVSLKDDVMGDIARLIGYDNFKPTPLTINFEHATIQKDVLLERRIREYLAFKCGFNEIFTYPWIDIKYINAARIDTSNCVELATPPSPETATLRSSLIPGLLEAINKNLRYYNDFKLFEVAQVFTKGNYYPSSDDENLPIHKKLVSGCIVGKNAKEIFFELKGVIEHMAKNVHMEDLLLKKNNKPSWADNNAYLNIFLDNKEIGSISLLSYYSMNEAKIKRTNVAIFEMELSSLQPLSSRNNEYKKLPSLPPIEKDLSLIMDKNISWESIYTLIKPKVNEVIFIEEYNGDQIPKDQKSIVLRLLIDNKEGLTSEDINKIINNILKSLEKCLNVKIRDI